MSGGFKLLHLMRPFQGFMPNIETPLRKVRFPILTNVDWSSR